MMDRAKDIEKAEQTVGRLLTARLDEGLTQLGPDIGERLRFARERAVARARQAQSAAQPSLTWAPALPMALAGGGGSAAGGSVAWGVDQGVGGGQPADRWWTKLASLLPLLVLALGLLVIQDALMERQIQAAAEVDAALLADDLPPQAYSDPGFAEFLRRQER